MRIFTYDYKKTNIKQMRQIKHLYRNLLRFPFICVYSSYGSFQTSTTDRFHNLFGCICETQATYLEMEKRTGYIMDQETVRQVCKHCNTTYTAPGGRPASHCVQCFSCGLYKPFSTLYGRVGSMGYCCRECEATDHWSARLVFDLVLNLPSAVHV